MKVMGYAMGCMNTPQKEAIYYAENGNYVDDANYGVHDDLAQNYNYPTSSGDQNSSISEIPNKEYYCTTYDYNDGSQAVSIGYRVYNDNYCGTQDGLKCENDPTFSHTQCESNDPPVAEAHVGRTCTSSTTSHLETPGITVQ